MGIQSCFANFSKKDNFCDFLFASLGDKTIPKRDLLLEDKYALSGANSYLQVLTSTEEVTSPDNVSTYLKKRQKLKWQGCFP